MVLFWRRLAESFVVEIALSILFAAIVSIEIVSKAEWLAGTLTAVCLLLNLVFHVYFLREYLNFDDDLVPYFTVNLAVLFIFAAVNVYMSVEGVEPVYTYMFLPYKLGMYLGMEKTVSAFTINAFMAIFVFLIPFLRQPDIIETLED